MRRTTDVPTTMAIALDSQSELLPISLTTSPLSTPWWRPAAFLYVLRTWMTSMRRHQALTRQDVRPDFPRQDTPVDILARQHTFLYAYSLSG
jgi:hypothetical protein